MESRFRLMPLAIIAIFGLLGVKVADLWSALNPAPAAQAQGPTVAAKPRPDPAPPPAPAAAEGNGAEGSRAIDPLAMSATEIELLQKLSERRAELDRRAAELSQREVLLQAAEKRIDEKIAKLAALEKEIAVVADKQSAEEDARVKSLVKIYETMKPAEAARILEQLDLAVLLGVIEHMKEAKVSGILASMDPTKARALTDALAMRRDGRPRREGGAAAATPSAPPKS